MWRRVCVACGSGRVLSFRPWRKAGRPLQGPTGEYSKIFPVVEMTPVRGPSYIGQAPAENFWFLLDVCSWMRPNAKAPNAKFASSSGESSRESRSEPRFPEPFCSTMKVCVFGIAPRCGHASSEVRMGWQLSPAAVCVAPCVCGMRQWPCPVISAVA